MPFETIEESYRFGEQVYRIRRVRDLDKLVDEVDDALFNEDERLPYWAELWPAAIGLSRYLSAQGNFLQNKTVLELGCGLGLTTLVIAYQNPAQILASDYEQDALNFTADNFKLNQMHLPELKLVDWREPDLDQTFDYIVASDVLYEKRFFRPLVNLFNNFLKKEGQIVLAEPGRSIARSFFQLLLDYDYKYQKEDVSVVQAGKTIVVSIYKIQKKFN